MHARHYNPNLGRFLSVDPGRDVDPKVPQAWNMYAYVRGNPMKYVDPSGDVAFLVLGVPAGYWALAALTSTATSFVVAHPELGAQAASLFASVKGRFDQAAERNRLQRQQESARIYRQQQREGPKDPKGPRPPLPLQEDQPGADKPLPHGWNLPPGLGTVLQFYVTAQAAWAVKNDWTVFISPLKSQSELPPQTLPPPIPLPLGDVPVGEGPFAPTLWYRQIP
jgi:hypothetical protein